MTIANRTTKQVFITLAMSISMGALAAPISGISISGPSTVWGVSAPGILSPGVGTAVDALTGNAASPTGNVELSKFGGAVATLNGTVNGASISLSSLVLGDWTAGGNALATQYIQDAATSAGLSLTATQLGDALNNFFNLDLGGLNPWQLVSDPNISYVNGDAGTGNVSIGLAGFLDASPFLSGISGITLDPGEQVSEVVKVTYNGITDFIYGFSATDSGLESIDGTGSFTGNYEVQAIPLPGILWLFGIGLAGLAVSSHRRQSL